MSDVEPVVTLNQVFAVSERIVGRSVGDGFVLVPLARRGEDLDAIFDLNPTAAFIWHQLDGCRDGHAIVSAVIDGFEVDEADAARDYLALMRELLSLHAVRLAQAPEERA